MNFKRIFSPVSALGIVLLSILPQCKQEAAPFDERDKFVGTYHVSGTYRLIQYQPYSDRIYREETFENADVFRVTKAPGASGKEYLIISGATGGPTSGYTGRLSPEGTALLGTVSGDQFTFEGKFYTTQQSGVYVKGTGTLHGDSVRVTYRTSYRDIAGEAIAGGIRQ